MRALNALNRKLLRDLWTLRGQMLAIALVLASGVAAYVGLTATHDALLHTRDVFYEDYRFAEVFAGLKRAPEHLEDRLAAMPGVDTAVTRVLARANLDVPGFDDPATARLVSIPNGQQPPLNRLYMTRGRLPRPRASDEIVVSQSFAEAHALEPGDTLTAIINGRQQQLRIVGIGMSPEFIYQIKPGNILPDYSRFAVMWMNREPLATAYDMRGAFNSVVLSVDSGAAQMVVDRVDQLLDPYGGLGAHTRAYQLSHRFLASEMEQLGTLTTIVPFVFLGVAAFLLHVVVTRLIRNQREQIGILKAFGYRNRTLVLHYVGMVLVVAAAGAATGVALGFWIGSGLSSTYQALFRFPFLIYELGTGTVVVAVAATAGAALLGTLGAVWQAARLPPAQAMSPEPPPVYRETLLERTGLRHLLDQPSRMIARHIERTPVKTLLSVLGIAAAIGIMVLGRFGGDAIRYMAQVRYELAQQQDITANFTDRTDSEALYSLRNTDGVRHAEPFRVVSVELVNGYRSYRTAVLGLRPDNRLYRILNRELQPVQLPPAGVVLTDYLAGRLDLAVGDRVKVRVLEGEQRTLEVPVAGFAKEYLGAQGYMRLRQLNRALGEGRVVSGAHLVVQQGSEQQAARALQDMPRMAGIGLRRHSLQSFNETIGELMGVFALVSTILASTIAFGVVYNSARIALSERSRELASLRVLGYSRGEVAYIILGELAVITLVAIPPGLFIGRGLSRLLAEGFESDLYRIPLVVGTETYGFAALGVLVAAGLSALLILRRLNRLSLVDALKTRE